MPDRLRPQIIPSEVTPDPRAGESALRPVHLTLANGRTLSAAVEHPKGDPENPLSAEELTDKFRHLASHGGHAAQTEKLIGWVKSLAADRPLAYGLGS